MGTTISPTEQFTQTVDCNSWCGGCVEEGGGDFYT